ncbi:hypothetical protein LC724_03710 [Blautia sp. RD014234]|nr:hypothetical protein [Blautia parvula]
MVGKSIEEIQKAVKEGQIAYEELTAVCLYRIKTLDRKEKGYNSVISINEHAMDEAAKETPVSGKQGKRPPEFTVSLSCLRITSILLTCRPVPERRHFPLSARLRMPNW